MTRPLEDLLGQSVLFNGYLFNWRTNGQGHKEVCLDGVTVRDYRCDRIIRRLDHVWIRIAPERWDELVQCHRMSQVDFGLKEPAQGAAVVMRYWRADGTWDYGLQHHGFLGTAALAKNRRRLDCRGKRRTSYLLMLRQSEADWLPGLEWALTSILQGIADQQDDWRFFGRDPANALGNLRAQLALCRQEMANRREAQAQADLVMATVAAVNVRVPLRSHHQLPAPSRTWRRHVID